MPKLQLQLLWKIRQFFDKLGDQMIAAPPFGAGMDPATATEAILQRLSKTDNNLSFLETLNEDQD